MGDQNTEYGRGVGDARDTVGLVGAVVDMIGRPISSAWQRRSAVQEYRNRLGEWHQEAVDTSGRWLKPVLRHAAFEEHLIKNNGYFKPSGVCQSSFAWAHLLYALDVRPGGGVLAWRLPPNNQNPADTRQVSLDIDGQVLCHIVNLYRVYHEPAPSSFSRDLPLPIFLGATQECDGYSISCDFPFGIISTRMEQDRLIARFMPGTPQELSTARVPFTYQTLALQGTNLSLDPEALVASYYNTLYYGISDTSISLPSPLSPLKERARALNYGLECLRKSRFGGCSYLLTHQWLEYASRIKRRATTNGGEDQSLTTEIVQQLANTPTAAQQFEMLFPDDAEWRAGGWQGDASVWLRGQCMSSKERFELSWTLVAQSPRIDRMDLIFLQHLANILTQFQQLPQGDWKRDLSNMTAELTRLLDKAHSIENASAVVLELTADSNLWKAMCEIQA